MAKPSKPVLRSQTMVLKEGEGEDGESQPQAGPRYSGGWVEFWESLWSQAQPELWFLSCSFQKSELQCAE